MEVAEFKEIVESSTLVAKSVKNELLQKAASFPSEKRIKIAQIITDGEKKKSEITTLYEESLKKLAIEYMRKIEEFKRKEIPRFRKMVEKKDREKDTAAAEGLLSEIKK